MTGRLLEGDVLPDVDPEIERLRADNRQLRREVDDAKLEAKRAREDAGRALSMLRRQLSPLYRALQAVFGELDAAGISEDAPTSPSSPARGPEPDAHITAVWQSWKEKLAPACGKVIDALLIHGDLSNQQLKVACRLGTSTVTDAIYKLNKAGLINKAGGRVSLKQL